MLLQWEDRRGESDCVMEKSSYTLEYVVIGGKAIRNDRIRRNTVDLVFRV